MQLLPSHRSARRSPARQEVRAGQSHRSLASWAGLETAAILIFAVISTPVVAYFLGPEQLGRGAIAFGIVGIVEIVACTGWHDALVRTQSIHTRLTDSAHTFICTTTLAAMLALIAVASPIANAFGDASLRPLLMVSAIALPVSAATMVPSAILVRKMRARAISTRWILHRTAALGATLALAAAGAGAMSIAVGAIAANVVSLIVLLRVLRRFPRLVFQPARIWDELRPVFRYARGITAEALLSVGMIKVFGLLVGWLCGPVSAGFFQLSQRIVDETAAVAQTLIARYSLAHFAQLERAGRDPTTTLLVGSKITAYVSLPLFGAMAVCADDIVRILFGSGWAGAAGVLRYCAIGWMLAFPVQLAMPLLRASGQQQRLTLYAFVSALLAVSTLVVVYPWGMWSVGAAWGARHLFAIPFAIATTSMLLGVSWRRFAGVLSRPALAVALTIGFVAILSPHLSKGAMPHLLATLAIGGTTYLLAMAALDWNLLRSTVAAFMPAVSGPGTSFLQQKGSRP